MVQGFCPMKINITQFPDGFFGDHYMVSQKLVSLLYKSVMQCSFPSPLFFILLPKLLKLPQCFFVKINPHSAKILSNLHWSTGLSVSEIAKKLEKFESWVIKWSLGNKGEDQKSCMRQLKKFYSRIKHQPTFERCCTITRAT